MDDRKALIQRVLVGTDWAGCALRPIAGDASARRYFRVKNSTGRRAIVMDSPPAVQSITPFLRVAEHLRDHKLSAPQIYAVDDMAGIIVMEDLGDDLYANVTLNDPNQERPLYEAAVDVLATLDRLKAPVFVSDFDAAAMTDQIDLLFDWFIGDAGKLQSISGELETVLRGLTDRSLLLRDFHAENLLWLPDRDGNARVGLLDFQDAMRGPAGYDLVSLLQDARRDVTAETTNAMIARFADLTGRDHKVFAASYATIGLQRNLRILGIFARLCLRDGKPRYVDFIPRVWGYVQTCLAHPSLSELQRLVNEVLPAPTSAFLQGLKDRCGTLHDQ